MPSKRDIPHQIYWRRVVGLQLADPSNVRWLRRELEPLKPGLVVSDTLAKVMGLSDENSNASAVKVTGALCELSDSIGCSVLVLAHPSKGDDRTDSIRGAGELSADPDILWSVHMTKPGRHVVTCVKDRDGDVEGRRFGYTVESNRSHTRTVLQAADAGSLRTEPTLLETALLNALRKSPDGLQTKDLTSIGEVECAVSRVTVSRRLALLRSAGRVEQVTTGVWRHVPESSC